jgi:hypothetical protein
MNTPQTRWYERAGLEHLAWAAGYAGYERKTDRVIPVIRLSSAA